MRRKRGFTLDELMVVLAICAVLMGFLLPAVQAALEAARELQWRNNLKQFGLALHNYHDVHQKFPRGASPNLGMNGGWEAHGDSPITMLLPFIEQSGLYAQFDLARGKDIRDGQSNTTPTGPGCSRHEAVMPVVLTMCYATVRCDPFQILRTIRPFRILEPSPVTNRSANSDRAVRFAWAEKVSGLD